VIEPAPLSPSAPEPKAEPEPPAAEPIVLEDLAALLRIPALFGKIDKVLWAMQLNFRLPDDFPFQLLSPSPGDGVREYGLSWSDEGRKLRLFAGMSWGTEGHDPIWEVRVEALPPVDAAALHQAGVPRIAAKRAESRFSEWDRFWYEEKADSALLFGASASCTRFFEEPHPDATAANYMSSALYALQASGALQTVLAVVLEK
jgi:hypothetical protein